MGFTVTELLTVVAIIALIITIGAGSWRVLVGTASVEGAQNLAAAFVGRVREEAMSTRRPRGAVFFHDAQLDRITMGVIYHDDPSGRPVQVELMPDSDVVPLQGGVGAMFTNTTDVRYSLPGVLLFDGYGQLYTRNILIRADGALGRRMSLQADMESSSHIGLTLYQLAKFPPQVDHRALQRGQTVQLTREWVNRYATSLLINRYNGQFIESAKRRLP